MRCWQLGACGARSRCRPAYTHTRTHAARGQRTFAPASVLTALNWLMNTSACATPSTGVPTAM
jgi:hypothetical protein